MGTSIAFICACKYLYYVVNPVHIPRIGEIVRPPKDTDCFWVVEYVVEEVIHNYNFPNNLPEWDKNPLYVEPCRPASIVIKLTKKGN